MISNGRPGKFSKPWNIKTRVMDEEDVFFPKIRQEKPDIMQYDDLKLFLAFVIWGSCRHFTLISW